MRAIIIMAALGLAGCLNAPRAQNEPASSSSIHSATAKPAALDSAVPGTLGLADLDAMTFDCPKAGLNAAAREAAKAPSQGTYQFSYFRIINDAHHASYEVHFKSNYVGEPELRYCVLMYCQQGWNPNTTKIDVKLLSDDTRRRAASRDKPCGAHMGDLP
jgi:hypothetical protein